MKILFIAGRNIYNTNGEIRLIKNRANSLFDNYEIITDFICYRDKDVLKEKQEIINEHSKFYLITYSKNPFSIFYHTKDVVKKAIELLKNENYAAVVISGEIVLKIIDKLRKVTDIPIIYDVHGVCDELKEFRGSNFIINLKRNLIYRMFTNQGRKYIHKYDAAFVVTNELKKHTIDVFNADKLKYFIVPCAKKDFSIDVEFQKKNREQYRKKYGIQNNTLLFIYSGGVSPWQCIDETIDIFLRINKILKNSKLLILSNDAEKINTKNNEAIIKDSVAYDKVDATLCSGDFAFMIRGDYVTNHVAFPNKYCEYVASGMKIICSPYLFTIANNIRENDIGYIMEEDTDINELIKYIESCKEWGNDFDRRKMILDNLCFDKTLKPFAEYLGVSK